LVRAVALTIKVAFNCTEEGIKESTGVSLSSVLSKKTQINNNKNGIINHT
jgi:hypothetical protein